MNIIIFNYIVSLAHLVTDPVSVIYLGLATMHLFVMNSYLNECKCQHAFCAGVCAILYSLLAGLHGIAN